MAIVFGPNYTQAGQEQGTSLGKALLDAQTQESVQQARNVAAEHQVNLKNAFEMLRQYGAQEQTMTPDGRVVGRDGKPIDATTQAWRQQLLEWASGYIQHSGPTMVWRGWKDLKGDWHNNRQGGLVNFPSIKDSSDVTTSGLRKKSPPPPPRKLK